MHAGFVCGARACVCVSSIDQVFEVDLESAGQDKLNDAIVHTLLSLFHFSCPTFKTLNFANQL